MTLTLADEIDCSRGDVIVGRRRRPEVADQFDGHDLDGGRASCCPAGPTG